MKPQDLKIVMEAGFGDDEKPTQTLTVTKSAEETYYNVCWHSQVEYNGTLYEIVADEDSNGSAYTISYNDPAQRYGIGEEVDSDTYEFLYDSLTGLGVMTSSDLVKGCSFEIDNE
jgi:hypothetical protein